jgi:general secretion pathway protein H
MPTSAHGSRRGGGRSPGFTLIELLIVLALVGLASGLVALSIRDPAATRLDQEAVRLASLLESARAESRAMGVPVRWVPAPADKDPGAPDFRFVGLPRSELPVRWLDAQVRAEVEGGTSLLLGPEPVIGAQRVALQLSDRRIEVGTDGLAPFAVMEGASAPSR